MSDVNIKGLSELQGFLSQLPAKMEAKIMRGACRAGMAVVLGPAKAAVPAHTGLLRGGLKISTRLRKGVASASIKATGKHAYIAKWVEYGVAAHDIAARVEKVLYFGGFFDKEVRHPGLRPKPFMRPALDTNAQAAVVAAGEYIKLRLTKQGLEGADEVDVVAT